MAKKKWNGYKQVVKPKKHDHVNHMIWDDDYCCCRVCEQQWFLTPNGWVPKG